MKRFLTVLIAGLALFGFSACGSSDGNYVGKEIETIRFESVDYFGGATYVKKYDFINNVLTIENKYPYYEDYNKSETYSLNPAKYEKLFDDLNSCGFFRLKELYYEAADDGGETAITVSFTDKTTFQTKTVNSSNGIEKEIAKAFEELTAE